MASLQAVQVALGSLDTKTDPKRLQPGALTLCENASSQTPGVYKKRSGYKTIASVGSVAVERLAGHGNELCVITGALGRNDLRAYVPDLPTPILYSVGFMPSAETRATPIVLDQSLDIMKATRATANGVTVHAWIDNNGAVAARIIDATTGGIIKQASLDNSTTWTYLHAVAAGNYVIIFFISGAAQKLNYVRIDTTLATFTASTNFKSGANVSATPYMDACPLSTTDVVVVWKDNTPHIQASRFTASSGAEAANATISTETPVGIATCATPSEAGYCFYRLNAGSLRGVVFDPSSMTQTVAPFDVDVTGGIISIGCVRASSTSALVSYAVPTSGLVKPITNWRTITNAGFVGGASTFRNVAPVSKPWTYNGFTYVVVFAQYNAQPTYFTIFLASAGADPYAIAMHGYRTAEGGVFSGLLMTDIDQPSSGIFAFDLALQYKYLSQTNTKHGVYSFQCDFTSPTRWLPVEIGGQTMFGGGDIVRYDGANINESNFLLYPEITDATPGAVGASGMDNGTYSYIAIFETSDANGNTDRSTTSLIVSATTTAGAGLGKVTITIDHLSLTRIGLFTGNAITGVVSIFRTQANLSNTYYFVGQVSMVRTSSNFTYVDQANDTTITANRILYTVGGILDREPPIPATHMTVHQNRVYGISSEDRKVVFYSGQYSRGEGPWFSSIQQFRVDVGGDCVGVASMDDKLLVFKKDRIFKVYGQGPNQLGQSNDLTDPVLLTGDAGCVDPRSIVVQPDGVMFQSSKGLYIVTRGEQLIYAGEPADRYWGEYSTVTAANMLSSAREIRFEVSGPIPPLASPSGQKVVLNYQTGQWTTHLNYADAAAIDGKVVNGVYYWATEAGDIYQETPGVYLDPSSTYISMTIELGYVAASGPQGFVRHARAMVLGDWKADHGFEIQVGKDYSNVYTQSAAFSRTTLTTLSLEQLAIHIADQKGEAIRLRMSDYADGGSPGEGYTASAVLFYLKPIRGTFEKLLADGARA